MFKCICLTCYAVQILLSLDLGEERREARSCSQTHLTGSYLTPARGVVIMMRPHLVISYTRVYSLRDGTLNCHCYTYVCIVQVKTCMEI